VESPKDEDFDGVPGGVPKFGGGIGENVDGLLSIPGVSGREKLGSSDILPSPIE
jgi:hypothetical protein